MQTITELSRSPVSFRAAGCTATDSVALKLLGSCILMIVLTSVEGAHQASHDNRRAVKPHPVKGVQIGVASYYGKGLHGKNRADGEVFNKNEMGAAHPSYPFGTRVRVTNLQNDREVIVRINDRGPAQSHRSKGVIIDVSEAAASALGFRKRGKARVKLEVLEWGARRSN